MLPAETSLAPAKAAGIAAKSPAPPPPAASAVGARGKAMRSAEGAVMSTQTVPNERECNGIVARENPMTSEM